MNTPFDSRFAQNLYTRITEDLNRAHTELGNGSQIVADDASATGMKCAKHMGIILGLKSALTHIEQVNDEMNGKGDKKKKDQD